MHTSIYEFCEKNELRCITPDEFSSRVLEDIFMAQVDIGIVYAYGNLIPQSVIDTTKFGIINLHCSLLPAYRGAAPIQHALINNETVTGVTYFEINEKLDEGKMILNKVYTIKIMKKSNSLKVAVIMGSQSDFKTMKLSTKILKSVGIKFEIKIISAHRTPKRMYEFAQNAEKKKIEVIIAGAGGSAHLPGMISALTSIPVLGVPIESKNLKGLDSLPVSYTHLTLPTNREV